MLFLQKLAPRHAGEHPPIFYLMSIKVDKIFTSTPLFSETLGLFIDEKEIVLDLGHSGVIWLMLFNVFPKHHHPAGTKLHPRLGTEGKCDSWLHIVHNLLRDMDI